jgi:hypothetical protein
VDEWLAVAVRASSAKSGHASRSRGLAEPGQRPQALGICSRSQEGDGLVEPAWCVRQGIAHVACSCEELDRVEARGSLATKAGLR